MSERIEEIRERLGKATPGPWYQGRNSRRYESSVEVYSHEDMEHKDSHDVAMFATPEDAAFIANAPADVAFLLAEVERLERELGGANTIIRALAHREGGALKVASRDLISAPMPWTMTRTDDLDGAITITVRGSE